MNFLLSAAELGLKEISLLTLEFYSKVDTPYSTPYWYQIPYLGY